MEEMSFWDHLEEFRKVIFRAVIVIFALAIGFFITMTSIFDSVILAPCFSDFYLYQGICSLSQAVSNEHFQILPEFCSDSFNVDLINIKLASQFFIHMSTSFWLAIVFAFPIIIYLLWGFISPALYENEKKNARWAFLFGNAMFFCGVAVGYFVVFPLTLRFLAGYQISLSIPNQISLDSYMNNFLTIVFIMGVVFELPLLSWILSNMGLITKKFFSTYRRHALVVLLILAAFITPSGDPFTLSVVFIPLYLLYEVSALLVKKDKPEEDEDEKEEEIATT